MLPKPPNGYLLKDQAASLLRRFVMGAEMDAPTPLPKRTDPAQADEFLRTTLDDGGLKNRHIARCGELMRFFDLRARAPQLQKFLDRSERELAPYHRSITAVTLLGDLGDDAGQDFALQYYQRLVGHRLAPENYESLIDLFFHLPPKADPKWLSEPIQARMDGLKPKIEQDTDAAVEYYRLEDLLKDRLPTVVGAKKKRHDIADLKALPRRRQELIRCYLWLEKSAYVNLRIWAMMLLQRDCNAGQPADLAVEFQHAFQLIIDRAAKLGSMSPGDEEDVKKYATSCVRALRFYGGQLTEDQAKFAEKHEKADQNDVLYWEPEQAPGGS